MNGFFGRLARKWWLMLVLGVIIGLAAGLPLGSSFLQGDLTGTVGPPQLVDVEVGDTFSVSGGASSTPWQLTSYPTHFLEFKGEDPAGTFSFEVVADSAGYIFLSNGQTSRVFGVRVLPPWEPVPGDNTQ